MECTVEGVSMSGHCVQCRMEFPKNDRGHYIRTAIRNILSPKNSKEILSIEEEDYGSSYICIDCEKALRRITVPEKKRSHKRKLPELIVCDSEGPKRAKKQSFRQEIIERAITYLRKNEYEAAFRCLVKEIPAASRALYRTCSWILEKERKDLSKVNGLFREDVTEENINKFSWQNTLEQASIRGPATLACLTAMMPEAKKVCNLKPMGNVKAKRTMTLEEAQLLIDVRKAVMLSIPLYTAQPRKCKFLASCIALEMWKLGCPGKVFKCLNNLGICQGLSALRGNVDRLKTVCDERILAWKESVEKPSESNSDVKKPDVKLKGFGFCWENVSVPANTPHVDPFNLAACFAIQNRVEQKQRSYVCRRACNLSPYSFLPAPEDYASLRTYMVTVAARVILENFPSLDVTPARFRHKFSDQLEHKSAVISLGVTNVDPAKGRGCAQVVESLKKYVPSERSMLCTSDNLSEERLVNAQQTPSGSSQTKNFAGFVPAPGEYHKEMMLLQDFMTKFFKGGSVTARGTLANLKEFFKNRFAPLMVWYNFKLSWDMMECATHSYVALKAMDVMGITSPTDIPPSYPKDGTKREKKEWLERIAMSVVDFCWQAPSSLDVRAVADAMTADTDRGSAGVFPFCICGEAKDDSLVQCCSNLCPQTWFHLGCVGLAETPEVGDDWFCSADCDNDGSYIYCVCHERRGGRMVRCQRKQKCTRNEWYHLACIGKQKGEVKGRWYCCPACAEKSGDEDGVQAYSRGLMWSGLNLLVRRDAICEGNGPMMISHWKMDMLNFHNRKRSKYLIVGAHFLAGIAGFQPADVAFNLTWNRLANLSGNSAEHVPLDLLNESLNKDFKERMSYTRGNYSGLEADRCAQMCGDLRRSLDKMLTVGGFRELETTIQHYDKKDHTEDVRRFLNEYATDELLEYVPGRYHEEFEGFEMSTIENGGAFADRIAVLCNWMDESRAAQTAQLEAAISGD